MCYGENQVGSLKAKLIRVHQELQLHKNKREDYYFTKHATKSEKAALTRLIKEKERKVCLYTDELLSLRVPNAPSYEQISYLLRKTCGYRAPGEYMLPDNKNGFLKREDYSKTHLNYLDSLN